MHFEHFLGSVRWVLYYNDASYLYVGLSLNSLVICFALIILIPYFSPLCTVFISSFPLVSKLVWSHLSLVLYRFYFIYYFLVFILVPNLFLWFTILFFLFACLLMLPLSSQFIELILSSLSQRSFRGNPPLLGLCFLLGWILCLWYRASFFPFLQESVFTAAMPFCLLFFHFVLAWVSLPRSLLFWVWVISQFEASLFFPLTAKLELKNSSVFLFLFMLSVAWRHTSSQGSWAIAGGVQGAD